MKHFHYIVVLLVCATLLSGAPAKADEAVVNATTAGPVTEPTVPTNKTEPPETSTKPATTTPTQPTSTAAPTKPTTTPEKTTTPLAKSTVAPSSGDDKPFPGGVFLGGIVLGAALVVIGGCAHRFWQIRSRHGGGASYYRTTY